MKKVLKIFGITLATIVALMVVAAVVIPYVYKDEIMHFVTQRLGEQVKADIAISEVDVSVWGNIPSISIQLNDVSVKSTNTFNRREFAKQSTDTALYADRVLLSFNVLDFLFENYVVQQIVVHDAQVNFFMDSKSHHNCEFSVESDSSGNDIFVELSEIRFRNTQANYFDKKSKISVSEWFDKINFSGKFKGDDFNMEVFAAFKNKLFKLGNDQHFTNAVFKLNASLFRDSTTYEFRKLDVETPVGTIISNGTVQLLPKDEYRVDLNVSVETTVQKILKNLPANIADSIALYKPAADIYVDGNLQGKIGKKSMPSLKCNVACLRGSATLLKTRYNFETRGELLARNLSNLSTYEYNSLTTNVNTANSTCEISGLSVSDFNKLNLFAEGNLNLSIADVDCVSQILDYHLLGNVNGAFSFQSSLKELQNFSPQFFNNAKISADLHVNQLNISAPEGSPYDFADVSGHVTMKGASLTADSVQGALRGQNFTLTARGSNFIPYLIFDDENASCKVDCSIESINLTPFYNHYESLANNSESGTGSLTGEIRFSTQKLDFDPYFLTNAKAVISMNENSIAISQVNATTMHGQLFDAKLVLIDLPNGNSRCEVKGKIEKMSAKEIFSTFSNFDQTMITDKQIDGLISGNFTFSSVMDSNYSVQYPTADALVDMKIENGSLNNVETLVEIGKKMKMTEEFSNVQFSTLKNTIRLANDTLFIPDMHVLTNAFEMKFAGKHNISDNHFNFFINLFLKKTLSAKFNNKNKDEVEDFGEIEKNSDGNFKIPIKISGSPDDFKIDYDFRKSKDNVREQMKKERTEWQQILHGEDYEDSPSDEKPVHNQPKEMESFQSGFQIED